MLLKINSDVFDIVNRLKSIDKYYVLYFNNNKNKYELHNTNQYFSSYCLTFPFDQIDERMIIHTLKTRSENKQKILEEIEKQNQKLQIQKTKQIKNNICDQIKQIIGEKI